MDPIQKLTLEHRRVERVLAAFERYASHLELGGDEERAALRHFVEYFRGYADEHHMAKEEHILFGRMVEQGFAWQNGPLAIMQKEHNEARALLHVMLEQASVRPAWTMDERRHLAFSVRGYAAATRQHIHKEERVFYPLAIQALPTEGQRSLAKEFDAYNRAHGEQELRLMALGDELEARWASPATRSRHCFY